jgi:hypothetical protein
MNIRHRLEKSSGTKYFDENISPEMKALNTKFGIAHGSLFSPLIANDRNFKFVKFGILYCCPRAGCVRCRDHLLVYQFDEFYSYITADYLYTRNRNQTYHTDLDNTRSPHYFFDLDHNSLDLDFPLR